MVAIQVKVRGRELGLVPHGWHGKANVRVTRQQRLAALRAFARHHPGVAAFKLRQACLAQGLIAQLRQRPQGFPVTGRQRRGQYTLGLPVEVKNLQVIAAQLVTHIGQQWLCAKGGGKTVGHVPGDADGVFGRKGPWLDAQQVELHGPGVVGLVLVDAVQVRLQGQECRRLRVQLSQVAGGPLTDPQAAKQLVGIDQLWPQHFGQLAPREAAHDFHLKQPVLRLDIAQGAVHVGLVACADMRHPTLVITHRHRPLQRRQRNLALTRGQLALHIPEPATREGGNDNGDNGQAAFHGAIPCSGRGRHSVMAGQSARPATRSNSPPPSCAWP